MAPFKMLLLLSREKLHGNYKDLIGESTAHLKVLKRIDRFAKSSKTVLISGETGTGNRLEIRARQRGQKCSSWCATGYILTSFVEKYAHM